LVNLLIKIYKRM